MTENKPKKEFVMRVLDADKVVHESIVSVLDEREAQLLHRMFPEAAWKEPTTVSVRECWKQWGMLISNYYQGHRLGTEDFVEESFDDAHPVIKNAVGNWSMRYTQLQHVRTMDEHQHRLGVVKQLNALKDALRSMTMKKVVPRVFIVERSVQREPVQELS